MSITTNIKGTTVPFFKIGKNGSTIFSGVTDPSISYTIANGDLWLDPGTETIKIQFSGDWSTVVLADTISDYDIVWSQITGTPSTISGYGITIVSGDLPADGYASTYVNVSGDAMSGNLTFSGAGRRLIGDLSTSTLTDRLTFQSSVTDGSSGIGVIPNGTGTLSAFTAHNASDPDNSGFIQMLVSSTSSSVISNSIGSGVVVPLRLVTGTTQILRGFTSGRVAIGTSTTDNNTDLLQVGGTIDATAPAGSANNTQVPTTAWIRTNLVTNKITVSTTEPVSPAVGDVWIDTN